MMLLTTMAAYTPPLSLAIPVSHAALRSFQLMSLFWLATLCVWHFLMILRLRRLQRTMEQLNREMDAACVWYGKVTTRCIEFLDDPLHERWQHGGVFDGIEEMRDRALPAPTTPPPTPRVH